MTLWIALLMQMFSPVGQASEGGGGVKNGGSGVQCPATSPRTIMLDLSDAYAAKAKIVKIENRQAFFADIFDRLRKIDSQNSLKLHYLLNETIRTHGPAHQWKSTDVRTITILHEDPWSAKRASEIDWNAGVVHLSNGCLIFPISYLYWDGYGKPRAPVATSYLSLLDGFNQNILELHEAVYTLFFAERPRAMNVLSTRRLTAALLNHGLSDAALEAEIDSFFYSDYLFPSFEIVRDPPMPSVPAR